MSSKRSRAAFEADLQAHHSPYAFYGTPLPPLDAGTRDDGSYVPIWKQEVTDDRGRKRLHGAFTGGFSAGYFNTVGSKEGWTPATFVSSRQNRAKDSQQKLQQRPEDFMDEEDIREAEEAKRLQTSDDFAGFGSAATDANRRGGLMDLLKAGGETMGVKLLKKMGWREGQGIGPKVRRKANLGDGAAPGGNEADKMYLFAPEDSPMIAFVHKTDHKGLGFEGESRLDSHKAGADESDEDDFFGRRLTSGSQRKSSKTKEQPRRGAFGVGVLNDTGSDDEDPYSIGPQISYNRVIGGDKKKKKKKSTDESKPALVASNPLVNNKPVFISKKTLTAKSSAGFRKCHDGRLPLDGFLLADGISSLSISTQEKRYAPPEIPKDWKSSKRSSAARDVSNYVSTAEAAKASSLDPTSRAALLGEAQLPGKSIFDWMTPEARERIMKLTGKTDLPPALGEKAPKGFELSESQRRKDLWDLVPKLDKQVAVQALTRAVSGWMPYSEDQGKRTRYRTFLEIRAGLRDTLPDRVPGSTTDEWVAELHEFARAAEVFKPVSGVMASRFTSASTGPRESSDQPESSTSTEPLLRKPAEKPEDPAVAAAKIGMFGPMTRSTHSFYPARLLCKRLNVKPPDHVQFDPGEQPGGSEAGIGNRFQSAGYQTASGPKELVSKDVMDQLMLETSGRPLPARSDTATPERAAAPEVRREVVIEPERNEALEAERPGEAVFKAIFGSDDEDEEE
ncbi:G patch domain-containing protein 1 [Aspergillus udagawae]|uniref:G patch domain-containing protein 1 n=1 Tax=Aspergillus udagawae TaxID=91492 RepID=A0ABQ1AM16_9EURO|nr:G patch domain-containing protein 1 [Aspergillus udagawae]GFF84371.1 G patch domain-containing protein 1 [Aspergillus udagawae]GFG16194.1 G patch domain-containing protein 1 [Aspergillus udagawae]GFG27145.1 G patch domain-containing protein 1 [Aspergillus udagawae]